MTEPDVALTDYGLAILCSWSAWSLWRLNVPSRHLQWLWVTFFVSIAAASLTGGTVHGFFRDKSTLGYHLLWPATLLAIGITAASAWILTGFLMTSDPRRYKGWIAFATITFIVYAGVIFFYSQRFIVVILNYLPAMISLLIAAVRGYLRTQSKDFHWIAFGLVISFFGAFVQQAEIAIHAKYFNHNSTFHLIQAFGLWFLFKGSKGLLISERNGQ